jgi:ER membrane protein complex subunit 1
MLFMFNPITGAAVDLGIANLGFRIKQTTLLHQTNAEFLKGIVILDENDSVHVYPPSSSQQVSGMHLFVADSATAVVQGYLLKHEDKVLYVRVRIRFNRG